jgi:hypothetical protein
MFSGKKSADIFCMSKSRPENIGRLSSGKEKTWKRTKPKLAADIEDTGIPDPEEDNSGAKESAAMFIRFAGGLFGVGFFLVIVGWFILGVTILPFIRVGDSVWVTKWAAYPEGGVPSGTLIISSENQVERSLPDRFNLILLNHPEYSVSKVVAGPGFTVEPNMDTNEIVWKNEATGFYSDLLFQKFDLQAEYLSICVSGNCGEPGDLFLVPMRNVLGEVINKYSFPLSLDDPPPTPEPIKIQKLVGVENIIEKPVEPELSEELQDIAVSENGEGTQIILEDKVE